MMEEVSDTETVGFLLSISLSKMLDDELFVRRAI